MSDRRRGTLGTHFGRVVQGRGVGFRSRNKCPRGLGLFRVAYGSSLLEERRGCVRADQLFLLIVDNYLVFVKVVGFLGMEIARVLVEGGRYVLLRGIKVAGGRLCHVFLSRNVIA